MDTYVPYSANPAITTAEFVDDTETVRTAAAVYPLVTVKLHRTFCVDAPDSDALAVDEAVFIGWDMEC